MKKFVHSARLKAWASCIVGVAALAAMAPAQAYPWYQVCHSCIRDEHNSQCDTWVCGIYSTCSWMHDGTHYVPICAD